MNDYCKECHCIKPTHTRTCTKIKPVLGLFRVSVTQEFYVVAESIEEAHDVTTAHEGDIAIDGYASRNLQKMRVIDIPLKDYDIRPYMLDDGEGAEVCTIGEKIGDLQ